MGKLNFHASGEFITNFARNRYMESARIELGMHALSTAVPNIPEDIMISIIKGKQKLVGIDEVHLEPDDKIIIPYSYIKPTKISKVDYGWIAINGNVYGHKGDYIRTQLHDEVAKEIVTSQLVPYNGASNYSSVEDAGWIKFCILDISSYTDLGSITEIQRQRVVEFMTSHDLEKINIGWAPSVSRIQIETMDLLSFSKIVSMKTNLIKKY